MDTPVSDSLKDLLRRSIALEATAGTVVTSNMMNWANDLLDREEDIDEDHSPSGGEEFRPNTRPRLRIIRARPFLAVLDGGLC